MKNGKLLEGKLLNTVFPQMEHIAWRITEGDTTLNLCKVGDVSTQPAGVLFGKINGEVTYFWYDDLNDAMRKYLED